jgi:hypothetical protein
MSGLLVAGILYPVRGVAMIGPHEAKWSHLSPGDGRPRKGRPHQVILHTTKGIYPQVIHPGSGPAGRAQRTAEFWQGDPVYSGAHIVVGSDGVSACLADVVKTCAYHATVSNDRSIGIEIYQEAGGVIYQAAIDAAVLICNALADLCSIPRQYPGRLYDGRPLDRMLDGGRDCYGFFGHRDNTDRRGRGDPGDEIFAELEADGFEGLDIAGRQDLAIWQRRQDLLNAMGDRLDADGLPGPATMRALRARGFKDGRDLLPAAPTC